MSNNNQWRVSQPRAGEAAGVEVYCGDMFVCQMSHHPAQRQAAQDNASRIAACMNACEGIKTEALERHGIDGVMFGTKEWLMRLEDQRDALMAALESALSVLDDVQDNINPERGYADELEAEVSSAVDAARATIARMNGESMPKVSR
ncbi:hypothetical protein [Geopseudomonas aromaticivorans]